MPIPLKINWGIFGILLNEIEVCTHMKQKKEVVKSKPLIQLQTSFVKSASWRVLYA